MSLEMSIVALVVIVTLAVLLRCDEEYRKIREELETLELLMYAPREVLGDEEELDDCDLRDWNYTTGIRD